MDRELSDATGEERIAELERELERLERANRELRDANVRLAGERLPVLDAAAASALRRDAPARPASRRLRGWLKARLRSTADRILR